MSFPLRTRDRMIRQAPRKAPAAAPRRATRQRGVLRRRRRTAVSGPWRPRIAASSPRAPNTGAAIAFRSRLALAARRAPSPGPARSRRSLARASSAVDDRALGEPLQPVRPRRRRPKASITLPVAVAWATLGRPTRATLATVARLGTKSTVTASRSPGIESVAVSPGPPPQLDQVRPGQRAQIEPGQHMVGEAQQVRCRAGSGRCQARARRSRRRPASRACANGARR